MTANLTAAKNLMNRLTFGVELEFIFQGDPRGLAAAITEAGVAASFMGYTHQITSTWKIVTDASVRGGYEIVSPVLTFADMEQVRTVCDAITAAGATVDVQCGMHVHVGAREFLTEKQVRNVMKWFVKYEPAMDTLVPASRRNSRWANGFSDGTSGRINDGIRAVDAAADLRAAVARINRNGRYVKLNLEPFWRYGTVEFRQHSGTTDAAKVENWITLCMAFVANGAYGVEVRPVRNGAPAVDKDKLRGRMLNRLFGKAGVTPSNEMRRFFQRRARKLAA